MRNDMTTAETSFNRDALQSFLSTFSKKIIAGIHSVSFEVCKNENNRFGIVVSVDCQPVKTICQSTKPMMVRDLFNKRKLSLLGELERTLLVPVSLK